MPKITRKINPFHRVPEPAGAHYVGDWCVDDGTARHFDGTMRGADIRVDITGDQWRDGTVDRYMAFYGDDLLDAEAARRVAADLLAAADEIDQLNERDRRRDPTR